MLPSPTGALADAPHAAPRRSGADALAGRAGEAARDDARGVVHVGDVELGVVAPAPAARASAAAAGGGGDGEGTCGGEACRERAAAWRSAVQSARAVQSELTASSGKLLKDSGAMVRKLAPPLHRAWRQRSSYLGSYSKRESASCLMAEEEEIEVRVLAQTTRRLALHEVPLGADLRRVLSSLRYISL